MRKLIPLAAAAFLLAACGGNDSKTNAVELRGDEYAFVMPETIEGGWTTFEFDEHRRRVARVRARQAGRREDDRRRPALPRRPEVAGAAAARLGRRSGPASRRSTAARRPRSRSSSSRAATCCSASWTRPTASRTSSTACCASSWSRATRQADVPDADATLSLGAWQAAPQLEAGERTIELRNDGDQPGSVFLTSFEPGKTEQDLSAGRRAECAGRHRRASSAARSTSPAHVRVLHRRAREGPRVHASRRRARRPGGVHAELATRPC